MVLFPYKLEGTWMFDDNAVNLLREPFISGIPEIIDILTQKIPNAEKGFKLIFSENPFPDFQAELEWKKNEYNGAWYEWKSREMRGWLCPALFRYFETTPSQIYCKVEKIE